MNRVFTFHSVLGQYIQNFIEEKQKQGYKYSLQSYLMSRFDIYWKEHGFLFINLTQSALEDWAKKRSCESKEYQYNRICVVREFAKYMNGIGIDSYVLPINIRRTLPLIHVLCDDEIAAVFEKIDDYMPKKKHHIQVRMSYEYPILFRIIYCCGLRISEVCKLSLTQVDLKKGILTILDGKGNKDRIVYISDDLKGLCIYYINAMRRFNPNDEQIWLFPGTDVKKHIAPGTVNRVFNNCWNQTCFANTDNNPPTVHALRHTYIVKRVNLWMKQGLEMNVMMPYLSKYLGHKSIDETYYYCHYIQETAQIIREKDTIAKKVIPEVKRR